MLASQEVRTMKKRVLVFALILLGIINVHAQKLVWGNNLGTSGNISPFKSTTDDKGNVYITGSFSGGFTFNGESYTSYGSDDIFVAKYKDDGSLVWIHQLGGAGLDISTSIAISNDYNYLYISGGYNEKLYFDKNLQFSTTSNYDAYLGKINTNDGSVVWIENLGGTGATFQRIYEISIDPSDNIICSGKFETILNYKGISYNSSRFSYNGFLCSFGSNGDINWFNSYPTKNNVTRFFSLEASNHGIYVSGYSIDSTYYKNQSIFSSSNSMFLLKIDLNGTDEWLRVADGSGSDNGISVSTSQDGSVYLSGYFNSPNLAIDSITGIKSKKIATSINNSNDIFFGKYSSDGVLQWFDVQGSSADDRLTRLYTKDEFLIIAGQFAGQMTFNNENLVPVGGTDALGVVHDTNDNLLYALS